MQRHALSRSILPGRLTLISGLDEGTEESAWCEANWTGGQLALSVFNAVQCTLPEHLADWGVRQGRPVTGYWVNCPQRDGVSTHQSKQEHLWGNPMAPPATTRGRGRIVSPTPTLYPDPISLQRSLHLAITLAVSRSAEVARAGVDGPRTEVDGPGCPITGCPKSPPGRHGQPPAVPVHDLSWQLVYHRLP